MFFTAKIMSFGKIFVNFHLDFTIFEIIIPDNYYYLTKFVFAKVRNHLEGRPNATEADDA